MGNISRAPVLIVVCRANQCRSPLAEKLLRRSAEQHGVALQISSMGFLPAGQATPAPGIRAAAERGLDLSGHRSCQLDPQELAQSDLILASARAEARDLVAALPELWPRVHTYKQFVRWARDHPAPAGTDFATWADRADHGRARTVLLGSSAQDDLADPVGRSLRAWRRTMQELEVLAEQLLDSSRGALPRAEKVPSR